MQAKGTEMMVDRSGWSEIDSNSTGGEGWRAHQQKDSENA